MSNFKWLIGLAVVVVVIGAYWAFSRTGNKPTPVPSSGQVAGQSKASYFDENASVMFFYSDQCGWCQKEKTVLGELAKDGYRVKPMDVAANPDYWQQYQVTGTPTFIAKNGDKLNGYKEKDELKKWLDEHK
jgi:protein-disulfide isomerase